MSGAAAAIESSDRKKKHDTPLKKPSLDKRVITFGDDDEEVEENEQSNDQENHQRNYNPCYQSPEFKKKMMAARSKGSHKTIKNKAVTINDYQTKNKTHKVFPYAPNLEQNYEDPKTPEKEVSQIIQVVSFPHNEETDGDEKPHENSQFEDSLRGLGSMKGVETKRSSIKVLQPSFSNQPNKYKDARSSKSIKFSEKKQVFTYNKDSKIDQKKGRGRKPTIVPEVADQEEQCCQII